MKKNLSKIYTIVVIIALLILGAWSTWDIYQLRTSNSEAAKMNIDEVKKVIEDTSNKGIPFNDNEFFKVVRNLFSENPELEILTIYSHDGDVGIEYHYNKGEEIELLNLSESSPLTMKELPEYKYNQLMKTKLSGTLSGTGQTGLDLDLIYQVVDRNVIYDILIRVLIVVVVLFFTTLFMIFAMSRNKVATEETDEDDFQVDEDEISSEDDMSLDWDDSGFDESSEKEPDFGDLSLDNDEFADMDFNESGGEFNDLNLDGESEDFGDLNLDSDSDSDGFGDLNLDSEKDIDEMSFDDVSDDFGDINLDAENNIDEMSFDDVSDDFGDINLDSDLETDEMDNFDLGEDIKDSNESDFDSDEFDEMSFDDATDDFSDIDMDSDIPEEEDLLAMDHEISPSSEIDDFDFDNMDDSVSDDFPSADAPSLYSPKSGVGWEDFIEERVNLELERAAANDQDLVMGLIQCDSLTEDNYSIFADQLKEDFNYPDMIFEYKDKGFALIVPSTDLDSAIETLEIFTGKEQDQYGNINVGISSRNGRLLSGSRIFMEAENALHKAAADEEKNIVGFRSDPDKFREYLSENN